MLKMSAHIQVVPAQTRACLKAIVESLNTHRELKNAQSHIKQAADEICNNVSVELAAFFATITHRGLGVGRFCLIHNHQIDDIVLQADWPTLIEHVKQGRESCVEIYDNPALMIEDLSIIKKHLFDEYSAVLSALKNYKSGGPEVPILPCLQNSEFDMVQDNGHFSTFFSLTEQCHETICMASGKIPQPMDVVRSKRVIDQAEGDLTPEIYCYDLLELLEDLSSEDPQERINRHSKLPFDPLLSKELMLRYAKELKMMKRYHEWVDTQAPTAEIDRQDYARGSSFFPSVISIIPVEPGFL